MDDPGEELGQMDHDELLEEVITLRNRKLELEEMVRELSDHIDNICQNAEDGGLKQLDHAITIAQSYQNSLRI